MLRFDRGLNGIRLATGLIALVAPSWPLGLVLVLSTWLINVRWRGTFNGGSDQMTFYTLGAWLIALAEPAAEAKVTLALAGLVAFSYVVAGAAKWREAAWRSGVSLVAIEPGLRSWPPVALRLLAWALMTFEIVCPLMLLRPDTGLVWLSTGAVFHLINVYVLGLNRFFYAWIATYPALYALSHGLLTR